MTSTVKAALVQCGKNLNQIRNQKGFSVETLSVLSHVDAETIRSIENGVLDFPIEVIFQLAGELNVDFRQILVDPTTMNTL
ncbi:MAG: helix-turn-helix domain-containing protein [Mucilaginibacter sp.]